VSDNCALSSSNNKYHFSGLVDLIRVSKDAGGVGKQDYGMNKK
jgi:hypothetical protein